jgi:CRP-like cAMP-binding protein
MAKLAPRTSTRLVAVSSPEIPARKSVRNEILLGLPSREFGVLTPELELVELMTHQVLNEMGQPIEWCYFVEQGLVSILNVMSDGKSVEIGITGKEGFVGLPLVVGLNTSATRAVVQVAASAYRMRSTALVGVLEKCLKLEKSLNRYSQVLGLQAAQVAACNRLHAVEQRLARWLLMSQDRLGGDVVQLTQEFLAHMLGTRRASVTVAAGTLQRASLIRYTRGSVTIVNRARLEATACECYAIMTRQSRNWLKESH